MSLDPVTAGIDLVNSFVQRYWPDQTQVEQVKAQAAQFVATEKRNELIAAADIIKAEATSEGMLARNWRPLTMLVFVYIIANNYIFVQYANALGFHVPMLDLPVRMWDLLQYGITGYVIGRSAEKIVPQIADAIKKR